MNFDTIIINGTVIDETCDLREKMKTAHSISKTFDILSLSF